MSRQVFFDIWKRNVKRNNFILVIVHIVFTFNFIVVLFRSSNNTMEELDDSDWYKSS